MSFLRVDFQMIVSAGKESLLDVRAYKFSTTYLFNMAWVLDVMRNQELEKVLEVSNTIEIDL